jgi:hypothetical protein
LLLLPVTLQRNFKDRVLPENVFVSVGKAYRSAGSHFPVKLREDVSFSLPGVP